MTPSFFYRLFLRVFSKRIIKDVYQGVLARPADPPGLLAYRKGFAKRRELSWLISDLLNSDEARSRLSVIAPSELVTQAFGAVLRRAPTKEELDAHVARLASGQSIGDLLADLSAGRAGSGKVPQDEAEELVRAAFHALLQRDPEPTALAAYTNLLVDTGDIVAFLEEVGQSQEHIETLGREVGPRVAPIATRRPRAIPVSR